MADFIFRISPNIILGSYTTSRLGQFALDWGNRFMLILDPILKEVGAAEKITQSLRDRNIDFFVFDSVPEAADTKTIEQALDLAKKSHIHGIIAAGGGKVMNLARAVSALSAEKKELYAFVDGEPVKAPSLPLICLPTTNRDPFIFTDTVPLIDARSSKIKLIKTRGDLVKMVLFDPNMTVSLSENQIGAMTLETLCMAVEAYISQKSSFFSDMIAEKAVELLGYALEENQSLTVTTPKEELLAQAGCMASLAVATSAPGMASLLALCINSRYKISRSLVSAILLPYILEDGAKFKGARVAKLAKLLKPSLSEYSSVTGTPDAQPAAEPPVEGQGASSEAGEKSGDEVCAAFADLVRQHLAKVNLPARLKDLSVSIEQLSLAAEDAGQTTLMNTLARSMTSDDLFDLIKAAY